MSPYCVVSPEAQKREYQRGEYWPDWKSQRKRRSAQRLRGVCSPHGPTLCGRKENRGLVGRSEADQSASLAGFRLYKVGSLP